VTRLPSKRGRLYLGALYDFLQKNQIEKANILPAVHSTEAYFIKKFMKTGQIQPNPCKFFGGEKLSYFFVGRPAFKRTFDHEPDYWELPMCFVVDYHALSKKRIFPFDTGAFKSGLYPPFISMMDIDDFAVQNDRDAAEKIIGTFFGTNRSYFRLKNRGAADFESRFDVGILEEEIKALHKLVTLKDNAVDDRRFSIEIQVDRELELTKDKVMAVVLPETYIENSQVVKYIEKTLDAAILTYPIYPLKKDYYYYAIYEKVDHFFNQRGLYRV
jgi:hypothetical protein